jgi:site-specific recombinase XerD
MPSVCNEVFNRKLKDIAKMAGITKKLTTHVGRHTFATWALRNGVPIERLAKMLGHTKITQTQRYAKVLAADVYAEFDKLR